MLDLQINLFLIRYPAYSNSVQLEVEGRFGQAGIIKVQKSFQLHFIHINEKMRSHQIRKDDRLKITNLKHCLH